MRCKDSAEQWQLEEIGVSSDYPVNLAEPRIAAERALLKLLKSLDMKIVIGDPSMEVTSYEDLQTALVEYPVVDLVLPPRRMNGSKLADSIVRHIEPMSWLDTAGLGDIEYNPERAVLAVTQSWDVHLRIDQYLNDIRAQEIGAESRSGPSTNAVTIGSVAARVIVRSAIRLARLQIPGPKQLLFEAVPFGRLPIGLLLLVFGMVRGELGHALVHVAQPVGPGFPPRCRPACRPRRFPSCIRSS